MVMITLPSACPTAARVSSLEDEPRLSCRVLLGNILAIEAQLRETLRRDAEQLTERTQMHSLNAY